MAFNVVQANTSNEAYADQALNKTGAGSSIGGVTAAGIGGGGTIYSVGNWRVDNQNPSTTHYIIQVQRNGVFGAKSSIGGAKIPRTLITGLAQGANAAARTAELTRAIQGALTRSVGSWRVGGTQQNRIYSFDFFEITGAFSS